MKKNKALTTLCVFAIALCFCGCGKAKTSEEAKAVIDKINSIGDVDFDDEALIGECEDAYLALTDEQKTEVSNIDTLTKAREQMDALMASRPIPFSKADWETTRDQLVELQGKPDDEYDNDYYGHLLEYRNVENDGYKGVAKYGFENGKLTRVFFFIDGYNESTLKHFQDSFRTKYGEPTFNENGLLRWDTDKVSCAANGGGLIGDQVQVLYMAPSLGEQ